VGGEFGADSCLRFLAEPRNARNSLPALTSDPPASPNCMSYFLPNVNYGIAKKPPIPHRPFSDPNHLAPEDAFYTHSVHHRQRQADGFLGLDGELASADGRAPRTPGATRRRRGKDRGRSGSRRGRGVWKKLLWVKQKDCRLAPSVLDYLSHHDPRS